MIVDASLTLAWAFPDETTSAVRQTVALSNRNGAWVPSFWHIEVANALEMAVRRSRMNGAERDEMLEEISTWLITIDGETSRHAWTTTKVLAQVHRLTLYDAAYLELALRLGLPLATLDKALRRAAEAESVILLGL